jgi:hypothetical protein
VPDDAGTLADAATCCCSCRKVLEAHGPIVAAIATTASELSPASVGSSRTVPQP